MLLFFSTLIVHRRLRPVISRLENEADIYTYSMNLPIYSALESLLCDPFSTDPLPFEDPVFLDSVVPGRPSVTHNTILNELVDWAEESISPNFLADRLAASVKLTYDDDVADTFLLTHIRDGYDVRTTCEALAAYNPITCLILGNNELFDTTGIPFNYTLGIHDDYTPEQIFTLIGGIIKERTEDTAA